MPSSLFRIPGRSAEPASLVLGALRLHDAESEARCCRVSEIATRLALAMRPAWLDSTLEELCLGALLHDVGKLAVRQCVLDSPDELSAEEWEQMRRHPVAGANLARVAASLQPALAVIRHHHERWDGGGYPAGLKGTEIPEAARIVAVADAIDTVLRGRCYAAARHYAGARFEIQAGCGAQFDPDFVAAFLSVPRDEFEG